MMLRLLDPIAAEAWARVQATRWGKDLGFTHLQPEGDARNVVEAVNSGDQQNRAHYG